jgi:antitoxin ParD1/3/4
VAILNVSVPDQMKAYIDERLKGGDFSTTSEYVRSLVREDQQRRIRERIDALLLQGLDSGEPVEVTDEYLQSKRAELLARMNRSSKGAA